MGKFWIGVRYMRKILRIIILFLLIFNAVGCSSVIPGIEIPEPSVVYDINGREIKGLSAQNSIKLNIKEISPDFTSAIIAVEDKNFYRHHGVDPVGILRALYVNMREKKIVAGGSTITQQTAKNLPGFPESVVGAYPVLAGVVNQDRVQHR